MNTSIVENNQQLPVSAPTSLLQAITQAASNPAVDIEKMERLFQMHERMVKTEAETAFNAAMARAQAQMVSVVRDRANDFTKSTYATLTAINDAIVPIYTAEGFSISFDTADCPISGHIRTIALVSHKDGHTRTHHNDMPIDAAGSGGRVNKTAIQAAGSTQSYARRYLVCQIFNVTTTDDNDGNAPKKRGVMDGVADGIKPQRRQQIQELASAMKVHLVNDSFEDAVLEAENADLDGAEEWAFLWTFFDSKERSGMKKASAAMREKAKESVIPEETPTVATISDAQRKRLEAMISERGLDRQGIKDYCMLKFSKQHFNELTPSEYDAVCSHIENGATKSAPPQSGHPSSPDAGTPPAAGADTTDYRKLINEALQFASKAVEQRFALKLKGRDIASLTDEQAKSAYEWLNAEIDKPEDGK